MTKQSLLVLALVSWWTPLLVGQSPPPPPTPATTSNQEQKIGRDKNSPPDKEDRPPATLETTPTHANPQPPAEASKDAGAKNSNKSSFDYNALAVTIFTAALAYLAWLQWRAINKQADYMRDGLTETKRAADAAKASADAASKAVELAEKTAALTERAVVLLSSVELSSEMLHKNSVVIFTLKNFGRTVAHAVTLSGRCDCGLSGVDVVEPQSDATIAPEGTAEWLTKSLILGMQHDHIDRIAHRSLLLNFSIEAKYVDVFGQAYEYEAEGRYEPGAGMKRFVITSTRWKPA